MARFEEEKNIFIVNYYTIIFIALDFDRLYPKKAAMHIANILTKYWDMVTKVFHKQKFKIKDYIYYTYLKLYIFLCASLLPGWPVSER